MNPITKNYGLKGGELDASKHIAAAIPKLCNADEQRQLAPIVQMRTDTATKRLRDASGSN